MKTREPKDEHCVLQCTHMSYNIHDPIPLDNCKNHTALPYITILADNQTEFTSQLMDNIFKQLDIDHIFSQGSNSLQMCFFSIGQMFQVFLSMSGQASQSPPSLCFENLFMLRNWPVVRLYCCQTCLQL